MPKRILKYVGAKASFVFIAGVIATLRGIGYIWPETIPPGLQTLAHVPGGLVTWGWVWAIAGIWAIGGTFSRQPAIALVPFATVNFVWAGSYLIEWIASTFTFSWGPPWVALAGGEPSRDWLTCLSYFGLGVAALVVVRLVDPSEVKLRAEEHSA